MSDIEQIKITWFDYFNLNLYICFIMIDNIELIKPLLNFSDPEDFYMLYVFHTMPHKNLLE